MILWSSSLSWSFHCCSQQLPTISLLILILWSSSLSWSFHCCSQQLPTISLLILILWSYLLSWSSSCCKQQLTSLPFWSWWYFGLLVVIHSSKDVSPRTCEHKHEQTNKHECMSKIESFLECFVYVDKILKEYSLTCKTKYWLTWKNILPRVHGWMIFIDENMDKKDEF